MKFTTQGGDQFSGRSYSDVVFAMSQEKFREPRSQESYRRAVARRTGVAYGKEIDPSTDRSFIISLCEAGVLTRIY